MASTYRPSVAWTTVIENVAVHSTSYNYTCNVPYSDVNDPGYGTLVVGYYLADYVGNIYEVKEINVGGDSTKIRVYDIHEQSGYISPYEGQLGYVYDPIVNDQPLIAPVDTYRLSYLASDNVRIAEQYVYWTNRGLQITDSLAVTTDNVTKLTLSNAFLSTAGSSGWNGGNDISLEIDKSVVNYWTLTGTDLSYTAGTVYMATASLTNGLTVDTINEYTADTGVTIDGVLVKDNYIGASYISVTDTNDYFSGSDVETVLSEIGETRAINGYDLLDDSTLPDLAFDTSTRIVTVSVKSGSSDFSFWCDSKKFTKTTSQTVTIPDTTGTYYVYFDNTGTLQYVLESSVTDETFYENAITALVYWNAISGSGFCGDERHGKLMDARTHHYNHKTYGARYESGLNITGLTDGGDTFTGIESGYFWDEDIRHVVSLQSTAPFIYRSGADGDWVATTADNNASYNTGGTYDVWNEWTGATWQLTEGGATTDYWIIFGIITPDISGYNFKKVIGQNAYANRSQARAALETEIDNISTEGLPSPEFIFLFAWIVKRDGTVVADADGNTYIDLRTTKGGTSGTSVTASLASNVAVDVTNFDGILSSTDVDVQTALETIDDSISAINYWTKSGTDLYYTDGNIGIGTSSISSYKALSVRKNNTSGSEIYTYGSDIRAYHSNSTTDLNWLLGVYSLVEISGTANVTSLGATVGGYFNVKNLGTGYSDELIGIYGKVDNDSSNASNNNLRGHQVAVYNSGFANRIVGAQYWIEQDGASATANNISGIQIDFNANQGAVTNLYGIEFGLEHNWGNSGGSVTNSYVIYIDSSTNIGTTYNYAIYSDSIAKSYFAGNVGIGKTNPSTALDVAGAGTFSSNLSVGGTYIKLNGTTYLKNDGILHIGDIDGALGTPLYFYTDATHRMSLGDNDSELFINKLTEFSTNLGVTIEGSLFKDNNLSVTGNTTITGNLTVNGTYFTNNVETLTIEDNLAIINFGESGSGITEGFAGWEADRGILTPYRWGYNETTDVWELGEYYIELTTGTITGSPFTLHEEIIQATTNARGYIYATDDTSYVRIKGVTGTFNTTDLVTAQTSGATFTPSAVTTNDSLQPVATREDSPTDTYYAQWDATNNNFKTVSATSIIGAATGQALTKTDDTNVTLTLGGTPSTSLLEAVSLTLGWTGTLDDSRITNGILWNEAYIHSQKIVGNPHNVGYVDISDFDTGVSMFETSHSDVLVDGDFTSAGFMKTDGSGGYSVDTNSYSLSSHTHAFADLTSIPTTISGYGITDAYTKTETDAKYLLNTTDIFTGTLTLTGTLVASSTIKSTTGIFTDLTGGYIPYHQDDTNGLADSPIYTDGTNVGIERANPTSLLDLGEKGSVGGELGLWSYIGNAGSSLSSIIFKVDVNAGLSEAHTAEITTRNYEPSGQNSMDFKMASWNKAETDTTVMTLVSSGYVGIGTTSPDTNLHISKDTSTAYDITGAIALNYLELENTNTTTGTGTGIELRTGTGVSRISSILTGGSRSDLVFATRNSNIAEKMRITYDGNVGIGTTNPNRKLEVNGGSSTTRIKIASTANAPALQLQIENTGVSYTASILFKGWDASSNETSLARIASYQTANAASGDLRFFVGNSGVLSEKMRIDDSGYVGIGTTLPSTALDVVGTITTDSHGTSANWKSAYDASHVAVTLNTNSGLTLSTQKLAMGTPTTLTASTTNVVSGSSHTHEITGFQPLDPDLTSIAALSGTSGFLKTDGSSTWSVDTSTYITGNQTITLSGDVTGSGTTSITCIVVNDSHTHDTRYFTETEVTTWRNGTTQTEMGYLHGVTSDIQTQFNAIGGELYLTGSYNYYTSTALGALTTGSGNIAIGDNAGDAITTGIKNILIGGYAGGTIVTGNSNIVIDPNGGAICTPQNYNNRVLLGDSAGGCSIGDYGIALGYFTGKGIDVGSVAIGAFAANYYITGSPKNYVIIGYEAGMYVTNSYYDTFVGYQAGKGTSGAELSGYYNTLFGYKSGYLLGNTAAKNTLLGALAGDVITTGSNNLIMGYNIDPASATASYQLGIGTDGFSIIEGKMYNDSTGYLEVNTNFVLDDSSYNISSDVFTISAPSTSYLKLTSSGSYDSSSTTAISNGSYTGQILVIQYNSGYNIVIFDNANTKLAGNWAPLISDSLTLIWDGSDWIELSRSNN